MTDLILVVDDDFDIRASLADVLESEGYSVALAANGREALTQLETISPQVILLDLMMPEMGGAEFLEAFKSLPHRSSPSVILVLTAASRVDSQGLIQQGVHEIIHKPVQVDTLLSAVGRAVAAHQSG